MAPTANCDCETQYTDQREGLQHSTKGEEESLQPPDGGWGWVVCVASFWCNGMVFGVLNTFGVVYPELLKEYGGKYGEGDIAFKTSWVGSLSTGMTFVMSPVTSILTDRFGVRPIAFIGSIISTVGLLASSFVQELEFLYLTYGILLGLGASLMYISSLVVLVRYFKRRLGVVNGFATCGAAVFTIVFPLPLKYSLANLGLRHTFRVLAGLNFTTLLCALSYKPIPGHRDGQGFMSITSLSKGQHTFVKTIRNYLNVRIWRNSSYVIFTVSLFVSFLGYFIPFVHLVQHVKLTMPMKNGEVLVMCIGVASGVGRLLAGRLADFKNANRMTLLQASFVIIGISTVIIPFATYFEVLIILTLIIGLSDGCIICLLSPIAFDIVGPENAPQAIGFVNGIMSIPLMLGPPIAGFMYDSMGNYDLAFLAAGGPPLLGASIMFLVSSKKQHGQDMKEITVDDTGCISDISDEKIPLDQGLTRSLTHIQGSPRI